MESSYEGGRPSSQSLESDVSLELAEGLLAHVKSVSSAFYGLTDDVLHLLAKHLSVIRFSPGEKIMVKGEAGTWFGILLSGELRALLPNGASVPIPEGAIIGEMAIWSKGGVRSNSVAAAEFAGGIMAVMLADDLRTLAREHPRAGGQLMHVVGRAALAKQLDNLDRQLVQKLPPAIAWQPPSTNLRRGGREMPPPLVAPWRNATENAHGMHAEGPGSKDEPEGARLLAEILSEKGFDEDEISQLCAIAQYARFEAGAPLVRGGHAWPWIMVVLRGAVWLHRWRVEVEEGGQVGAVEFFERPSAVSPAPAVTARREGIVGGLSYAALDQLLSEDGALGHKLMLLFGQFGCALCGTSADAILDLQDEESSRSLQPEPTLAAAATASTNAAARTAADAAADAIDSPPPPEAPSATPVDAPDQAQQRPRADSAMSPPRTAAAAGGAESIDAALAPSATSPMPMEGFAPEAAAAAASVAATPTGGGSGAATAAASGAATGAAAAAGSHGPASAALPEFEGVVNVNVGSGEAADGGGGGGGAGEQGRQQGSVKKRDRYLMGDVKSPEKRRLGKKRSSMGGLAGKVCIPQPSRPTSLEQPFAPPPLHSLASFVSSPQVDPGPSAGSMPAETLFANRKKPLSTSSATAPPNTSSATALPASLPSREPSSLPSSPPVSPKLSGMTSGMTSDAGEKAAGDVLAGFGDSSEHTAREKHYRELCESLAQKLEQREASFAQVPSLFAPSLCCL